jgi:uncharacterized protein
MKIPKARVAQIASQMLRALTEKKDVETESPAEVQLDLEAVLNQYIRDEAEISEKARDTMAKRGLPSGQLGRVRQQLAEQRKFKLGEEALDYLVDQLIECLMQSHNVEEIYAPDHELRRLLREPLRDLDTQEDAIHGEVRSKMKHVTEGTAKWDVEYQRILEDVRRRKGL